MRELYLEGNWFPENQTPEDILRLLDARKTGDYVHVVPTGDK